MNADPVDDVEDVHMEVDQPRGDDAPGGIEDFGAIFTFPGGSDPGDLPAGHGDMVASIYLFNLAS